MKKTSKPPSEKKTEIKKDISFEDDESDLVHDDMDDLVYVGVGASAGGLEAFQGLLPNLPQEDNIVYIIAQHLDPSHPTMLVSLLKRYTSMPVLEVQDNQRLEPGHIFITPPGFNATLSGDVVRLTKPISSIGPKPSIDLLFRSLAENKGEKSVGIILSGTGSDGAHGIRAIKAEGGITIVQAEETARYNGMPHAAIDTGVVDLTLPPEKIGKELLAVIKYPHIIPTGAIPAEQAPEGLDQVFRMLQDHTGCDFSDYKLNTINRRVSRRMIVHKLVELDDYVQYLKHSPKELDLLFKDILISVTCFFRDPEAFKSLFSLVPKLIQSKQTGDSVRVWVPGCSTGEEAYSIAILLTQALRDKMGSYNVQVFGTDLDQEAINKARKGVYPEATAIDVEKSILDRYFVRKDNTVQVVESIREMIVFAKHNLIKDPPFSHLDLISCRNLLIYFNSRLQKRVVPLFHYILNPNGFLFLGKSESIGQYSDLFTTVSKKGKLYQKRDVLRAPVIEFKSSQDRRDVIRKPKTTSRQISSREIINEALANTFGASSALIDDRLHIVYVRGDLSSYLSFPEGEAMLDILHLAKPSLRIDLRTQIHRAKRESAPVTSHPLSISALGSERWFKIHVNPVQVAGAPSGMTLVAFEEITTPERQETATPSDGSDPRIYELEQELAAMKEHLQTTVEELETSNEELMSLNEELQSSNEELQSSNEELETTNEELQSSNEELTTVNEELQVKSGELATANIDLENILKKIGFPLIIVDSDLKVTRFNAEATRIFHLMAGDIGQVITTVGSNVNLPNLRGKLLQVIESSHDVSEVVQTNGRTYTMEIHPHYGEHEHTRGAILIFVDKTDIVKAEREHTVIGIISQLFMSTGSLEKTYLDLPGILADQYGFPFVTIELYDEKTSEFVVTGAHGISDASKMTSRIPSDATICGLVVDKAEPYYVESVSADDDIQFPLLNDVKLETIFCVPLRVRNKVFGVITLADVKRRSDVNNFKTTIQVIANHLAMEIDRKKTQEAHERAKTFYHELYSRAPMAFVTSDPRDGSIIDRNQSATDLLGYDEESFLHGTISDLLADDHSAEYATAIRDYDAEMKHHDGHLIPAHITVLPMFDSKGAINSYVSMIAPRAARILPLT